VDHSTTYELRVNAVFTQAMQISNQELKVFNAAVLGTDCSEVAYVTTEMLKRRIVECAE